MGQGQQNSHFFDIKTTLNAVHAFIYTISLRSVQLLDSWELLGISLRGRHLCN